MKKIQLFYFRRFRINECFQSLKSTRMHPKQNICFMVSKLVTKKCMSHPWRLNTTLETPVQYCTQDQYLTAIFLSSQFLEHTVPAVVIPSLSQPYDSTTLLHHLFPDNCLDIWSGLLKSASPSWLGSYSTHLRKYALLFLTVRDLRPDNCHHSGHRDSRASPHLFNSLPWTHKMDRQQVSNLHINSIP